MTRAKVVRSSLHIHTSMEKKSLNLSKLVVIAAKVYSVFRFMLHLPIIVITMYYNISLRISSTSNVQLNSQVTVIMVFLKFYEWILLSKLEFGIAVQSQELSFRRVNTW